MYYLLLFCSATIFSFQFLITKIYQKIMGTGIKSSISLSCLAYLFIAIIFYVKGGISSGDFSLNFSWFTFLITFLTAISAFSCLYLSIKVLKIGDMGIYSVFMMLGSVVLPTLVGITVYNEKAGFLKIIALFLMIVSVLLSIDSIEKSKLKISAVLCYFGVFVLNGMVGVLLTIHQNHPEITAGVSVAGGSYKINSDVFMTWIGISEVLLSVIVISFWKIKRILTANGESSESIMENEGKNLTRKSVLTVLLICFIYGLCNGFGDYFISLATKPDALGASVTFPIIDGGTIFISNLIGIFMLKEKISVKKIIVFLLVIISTVMFMFV